MTLSRFAFLACWSAALPGVASATTLNVGVISFDVLLPGGPVTGVNVFNISNFTGDPASGGFALAPDFPVVTAVTFLASKLTLMTASTPTIINLGDLGPGSLIPAMAFEFPDSLNFSSAVFNATLSGANLRLLDGRTFTANSSAITATLLPTAGAVLTPGTDFAVITVSDTKVPEPSMAPLLGAAILALTIIWKAVGR